MVKLEQALILDPPTELHFVPPFTEITTSYLKLTNPTERQICFKLKTTAPKTYCVRPNSGIILPKNSVTVSVMLQPVYSENAENMKHKFMVQSLFAPDGDVNQDVLWRETPGSDLMNSKLKCVFDVESSSQTQQQDGESGDMIDARNEEVGSASEVSAEGNQVASSEIPEVQLKSAIVKAQEENKVLMEKLKKLRMENAAYKEEHLRWRRSKAAQAASSQSTIGSSKPMETPKVLQENPLFNTTNIIISIVILFAGIILGVTVF